MFDVSWVDPVRETVGERKIRQKSTPGTSSPRPSSKASGSSRKTKSTGFLNFFDDSRRGSSSDYQPTSPKKEKASRLTFGYTSNKTRSVVETGDTLNKTASNCTTAVDAISPRVPAQSDTNFEQCTVSNCTTNDPNELAPRP